MLHYVTLRCTSTLHYVTLRYTRLRYTKYRYTTLHYSHSTNSGLQVYVIDSAQTVQSAGKEARKNNDSSLRIKNMRGDFEINRIKILEDRFGLE